MCIVYFIVVLQVIEEDYYWGRLILGIHSFPKGQSTLFASIYIYIYISNLVYNYIHIRGVCVVCDYISRMLVAQGNLINL